MVSLDRPDPVQEVVARKSKSPRKAKRRKLKPSPPPLARPLTALAETTTLLASGKAAATATGEVVDEAGRRWTEASVFIGTPNGEFATRVWSTGEQQEFWALV